MLGDGRPFYFELVKPTRSIASPEEMRCLSDEIIKKSEGKISVLDLQIVARDSISILKDSASSKSKSYRCRVEFESPISIDSIKKINDITTLELKQQNPTRVPRRADLIRDKVIESISIQPEFTNEDGSAKIFTVNLQTSAGTYVKVKI
jgi:tRNA pseudouridine synthase 10